LLNLDAGPPRAVVIASARPPSRGDSQVARVERVKQVVRVGQVVRVTSCGLAAPKRQRREGGSTNRVAGFRVR